MKRFYKNISKKFPHVLHNAAIFLAGFFFSVSAQCAPMGIVKEVIGKAFTMQNGKASPLKAGDIIEDMSHVITEVGGQITFLDYYNHLYHLSSAGHVQLMRRLIDLRSGHLWVQTKGDGGVSLIQTANAKITYSNGEAIVSYNSENGKTQVLSVRGQFDMCNQLVEDVVVSIPEGHFSFIQKDLDNGIPRNATTIGFESYKKVTAVFKGIESLSESTVMPKMPVQAKEAKRLPASEVTPEMAVQETEIPAPKMVDASEGQESTGPEVIYLKKEAPIKVNEFNSKELLAGKLEEARKIRPKKVWRRENEYKNPSGVKIQVFGPLSGTDTPVTGKKGRSVASVEEKQDAAPEKKTGPKRMPASLAMPEKINAAEHGKKGNDFEDALVNQYKKQMRHSSETNKLIEELKSFDQDYQKKY